MFLKERRFGKYFSDRHKERIVEVPCGDDEVAIDSISAISVWPPESRKKPDGVVQFVNMIYPVYRE